MINQLEHTNINVIDLDETTRFLTTALPNLKIRGAGDGWIHIGTDETYLAVNQQSKAAGTQYGSGVLNHIGFVVSDAQAVRSRLKNAGYEETMLADDHPHRTRVYFDDHDGIEWEFVEYHSDKPEERNDYSR